MLQWAETLRPDGAATTVPYFWPTIQYEMPLGVVVPRERWPRIIRDLEPYDVRVLRRGRDEWIFLSWESGSAVGWPRLLMISRSGPGPPAEVINHMALWEEVARDLYAGIRVHH